MLQRVSRNLFLKISNISDHRKKAQEDGGTGTCSEEQSLNIRAATTARKQLSNKIVWC
jgi:hypothetical protein